MTGFDEGTACFFEGSIYEEGILALEIGF